MHIKEGLSCDAGRSEFFKKVKLGTDFGFYPNLILKIVFRLISNSNIYIYIYICTLLHTLLTNSQQTLAVLLQLYRSSNACMYHYLLNFILQNGISSSQMFLIFHLLITQNNNPFLEELI